MFVIHFIRKIAANRLKNSNLHVPLCRIILNKMQVILADSNELIRFGLRTILAAQAGISIAGEARNEEELMAQLKNFGAFSAG